jgi:hypothetical protein
MNLQINFVRGPLIPLFALVFLLLGGASGRAAPITWVNTSGGNWSNPANWSPAEVPTGADTALITTPGTYIVNLDVNADVSSLTVGGASGLQTLQVNANNLTATNAAIDGMITTTNGTFSGTFTINSGGVLTASGGELEQTGSLTVQSGGVINLASRLALLGPLTNRGTINLTNASIALYNGNGSGYLGGIANTGQINLYGVDGDQINANEGPQGAEYLINQGTINAEAGAGVGSINGTFGILTGTYNAAAGTIIVFSGGWVSNYLTVGTPPVLNGPGQYEFTSGYLLLTKEAIPNLALEGGILELGPAFEQGGAITNLTLDGISLVGTNEVSGTLTATNSTFSGVVTIKSDGVLNATGGQLQNTGSLTVQGGGVMNLASRLALLGPLTNHGTINLTNASLALYNGNGSGYLGGIANVGQINLYGVDGDQINANEGPQGTEYLMNQGTISEEAGAGVGSINGTFGILTGTYNAAAGTIVVFSGGWVSNFLTVGTPPVLNGPGQYEFTSGYLLLTKEAISNLALEGGILELGPAFEQGGAITNLTLDGISLVGTNEVSGTMTLTNATFSGAVTIKSGGVLNATGGQLQNTASLTVQSGGVMNLASRLALLGPLTNDGTINLTNASLALYNGNGSGYLGGIVNAGQMNLYGVDGDQINANEGPAGTEYLMNQGTINEEAGTGVSSINGTFGILTGTYNAAAGTIIVFSGGWVSNFLTVGTPPVLNGPGQYEFTSGYLLLTEEAIPNLALEGSTLELGPAFEQGGAITNLTLDGISLVGTNEVSGTLTATNSTFSGMLTIEGGGILNEAGGQVTDTGSLTVNRGGVINLASRLELLGPLTNDGTINLTNASIALYNGNGSGYLGGIVNTGQINLYGADGDQINANEGPSGDEYIINSGTISQRPGTVSSSIQAPLVTNPGTLDSQEGTLTVTGLTLQSSSVLNFGLNSATDYGHISRPTNAALTGTVSANYNGGFVPAIGDEFNVLAYQSFSGNFSHTNLPAGSLADGVYGATGFSLLITAAGTGPTNHPILTIELVSGDTVAISWPTASGSFNLQSNASLSPEGWSTITSGITTVGANSVLTTTATGQAVFFRLQSQ